MFITLENICEWAAANLSQRNFKFGKDFANKIIFGLWNYRRSKCQQQFN